METIGHYELSAEDIQFIEGNTTDKQYHHLNRTFKDGYHIFFLVKFLQKNNQLERLNRKMIQSINRSGIFKFNTEILDFILMNCDISFIDYISGNQEKIELLNQLGLNVIKTIGKEMFKFSINQEKIELLNQLGIDVIKTIGENIFRISIEGLRKIVDINKETNGMVASILSEHIVNDELMSSEIKQLKDENIALIQENRQLNQQLLKLKKILKKLLEHQGDMGNKIAEIIKRLDNLEDDTLKIWRELKNVKETFKYVKFDAKALGISEKALGISEKALGISEKELLYLTHPETYVDSDHSNYIPGFRYSLALGYEYEITPHESDDLPPF